MNKQVEISKQILELTNTMAEGITFIKGKLNQQSPKEAINVLVDITNAFATIEVSLQPFMQDFSENSIQDKTKRLRNAIATIVKEYEDNQGENGRDIMQFNLEPAFKDWKSEIERVFKQV